MSWEALGLFNIALTVRVFCASIYSLKFFSVSLKNVIGIWQGLYWICRLLCVVWTSYQYWFLKSMTMRYLFIFLCSLHFLESMFYSIYCRDLSLPWLIPRYFILFVAILNGITLLVSFSNCLLLTYRNATDFSFSFSFSFFF